MVCPRGGTSGVHFLSAEDAQINAERARQLRDELTDALEALGIEPKTVGAVADAALPIDPESGREE